MLAEAGSAWSLLHPQFSVVVPQPNPLRWPPGRHEQVLGDLAAFVDDWLVVQRSSGAVDRAYDYWVLGKGAQKSGRRWTIMRDVLAGAREAGTARPAPRGTPMNRSAAR